jgi:hypothetical protein
MIAPFLLNPTSKKIYCEGACDHMALWNFRLRFEPSGLPPRTSGSASSHSTKVLCQNTHFMKPWDNILVENMKHVCTLLIIVALLLAPTSYKSEVLCQTYLFCFAKGIMPKHMYQKYMKHLHNIFIVNMSHPSKNHSLNLQQVGGAPSCFIEVLCKQHTYHKYSREPWIIF